MSDTSTMQPRSYRLIDGKAVAEQIKLEIRQKVEQRVADGLRPPCLATVLVGHDGGSELYVRNKIRACRLCGITSVERHFKSDISEKALLEEIAALNADKEIDGFIVQLPLPTHIDEHRIVEAIDPRKDVDGFHPINVGRMALGLPSFVSATPLGIITLLRRYDIRTSGKKCVVMGRSNIVGKPIVQMMLQKEGGDCTVTCVHSRTKGLVEECRTADILIVALGCPGFVTADMVKEGATVIDVGTTRVADATRPSGFRLMGDVDFETVAPHTAFITPVPGGVGPMTVCTLLSNTLAAAQHKYYPEEDEQP